MSKWISVDDELPTTDRSVLVVENQGYMSTAAYYGIKIGWIAESFGENSYYNDGDYMNSSSKIDCNPTHWMPLPEPPKGEQDG